MKEKNGASLTFLKYAQLTLPQGTAVPSAWNPYHRYSHDSLPPLAQVSA